MDYSGWTIYTPDVWQLKALSYHGDISVNKLDSKEQLLFKEAIEYIDVAIKQMNLNQIPKLASKKQIISISRLTASRKSRGLAPELDSLQWR